MRLNARKVFRPGNHTMRLLLAFEDITDRVQRERDQDQAKQEIYHRVKNSLTVIMSFVAHEARQPGSDARTLQALQGRIAAVAQLYDLIARSETAEAIRGDAYLAEIAANLSASLLGECSEIAIAVDTEPLALHKDASVPIGLMVNELATNAIKACLSVRRWRDPHRPETAVRRSHPAVHHGRRDRSGRGGGHEGDGIRHALHRRVRAAVGRHAVPVLERGRQLIRHPPAGRRPRHLRPPSAGIYGCPCVERTSLINQCGPNTTAGHCALS
ncbi:hypothetical protein BB934_25715 [Microvirga ossetica]|uniref:histidine kinase n=2 Tax=Microvirga ossetica TaxID=1882682 RepID=A0A1B2EMI7_9HYPH|nr:hypothetical protein BB934_25715 [Microvirga ossetica]